MAAKKDVTEKEGKEQEFSATPKEFVTIQKPDLRVLEINIKGIAPLCINRFGNKAKAQMKADQEAGSTTQSRKKRDPKDFNQLFQDALYISDEGWYGIHAGSFRNAAIGACRTIGYKMTHAKLAIFVRADGYDKFDATPLVRIIGDEPEEWVAPARNSNGSIDLRVRPLWKKWSAKLTIQYDAGMLTASDVINLIARVGLQCGIGEGRPNSKMSCGLGFGLFEIINTA